MLLEAQRRGYEIHYMEMKDLYLRGGEARAATRLLSVEQTMTMVRVRQRAGYCAGRPERSADA